MISKKMAKALNTQINEELASAYIYLAMSSQAEILGFKGTANWFMIQTQEEIAHAMKFYKYIISQGEQALMQAIAEPPLKYASPKAMFTAGLKHEKHITACIHGLVDIARAEKDYATEIFLQWFVTEQIEEEEHASEILGQLEMAGDAKGAIFMIDRELASRVFTPPAAGPAD